MAKLDRLYSDRAGKMRKSEIRELLKVAQDPEVISFAGGLPSPRSFPIQDLQGVVKNVLEHHGKTALQKCEHLPSRFLKQRLKERRLKRCGYSPP